MANITIGGNTHAIYGSDSVSDPGVPDPTPCPSANVYLGAKAGSVWDAGDDEECRRCLVSAQRDLDALSWAGTKTSPSQPLSWPRTGVVRSDGTAVDPAVYPIEIVNAEYELAYVYLTAPKTLDNSQGGRGNVKRLKAGSAEIEYFTPTDPSLFPRRVLSLITQFLGGVASAEGESIAYGTCGESQFDDSDRYTVE